MAKHPVKREKSAATAAAPTLLMRKQDLVRDAIWSAAIDLFAEQGFEKTTVEEIAVAAGISLRTFFRYFASKNDLLGRATILFGAALSGAIESCPEAYSQAEAMREALLKVTKQAAEYSRTEKVIRIVSKCRAAREAQMSRHAEMQREVAQAYARRHKNGKKGDLMPGVLAAFTISLFDIALQAWLDGGRRDIEKSVKRALESAREIFI